jgi:hypothetical protein
VSEFPQCLQTKLDGTETDTGISLLHGWMKLAQGQHCPGREPFEQHDFAGYLTIAVRLELGETGLFRFEGG